MEFARFAKARMIGLRLPFGLRLFTGLVDRLYADPFGVGNAQRQLIPVYAKLHRVAHGGELDDRELRARYDAHIEKMLAERLLSADREHPGGMPGL